MRIKILTLACIMLLAIFAGCGQKSNIDVSIEPNSFVITTEDELYKAVERWAGRLDRMAESAKSVHDKWDAGDISREEYFEEIQRINEDMKGLKRESDLKTEFELTGSEIDELRWDNLMIAYDNAKKGLNDYFVLSPELSEDQQVKDMYVSKVEGGYQDGMDLLKEYLDEYFK